MAQRRTTSPAEIVLPEPVIPSIEVHAARKSLGGAEVLRGISLSAAPRERLVLVGPSGCGKTTLLRCLSGLMSLDSGEIRYGGEKLSPRQVFARLGFVFQDLALYPNLTVYENIAFGLRNTRQSPGRISQRVDEIMGILEIAQLAGRLPSALSGGQRQRVALGRALARSPSLLFLDEPFSSLDADLRETLRYELLHLHRTSESTMLFVTHDQSDALILATRIAVMEAGRVRQIGTPEQIYGDPADSFVARFFGYPKINLLPLPRLQGLIAADILRFDGRNPIASQSAAIHSVGLRPDAVRLTSNYHRNGSAARIVHRTFLADRQVFLIETPDGGTIEAATSHAEAPEGDSVVLHAPSGAAFLFDEEGVRVS